MEPGVDEDEAVAWWTVKGVRILPGGERQQVTVLVRADVVNGDDS